MDEAGILTGERKESIEKNLKKLLDELEFYTMATMAQKEKSNGVPFE